MADESRTLNTAPGGDFTPLFDYLKGEQKLAADKEFATHANELSMQKQAAGYKFDTILENLRNSNLMQRQAQQHELGMQDKIQTGGAIADYIGGRAVQEAQGGNVIDSLVERRPGNMEPEGGTMDSFVPRPINPLAAETASKDLFGGIEARRRTTESAALHAQNAIFDSVGPEEIKAAQAMIPQLELDGNMYMAERFRNLAPGSMTKRDFNAEVARLQGEQNRNTMYLERASVYAKAREAAAKYAADARREGEQLRAKRQMDNRDLQLIRLRRQGLEQSIVDSKMRISTLNLQLAEATGQAKLKLMQDIAAEQNQMDTAIIAKNEFELLYQTHLMQSPVADRKERAAIEKDTQDAIREAGFGDKRLIDLKPDQLAKVDEIMKKKNPRYNRQ